MDAKGASVVLSLFLISETNKGKTTNMKTKLKSILAIALCAVGLSAFAEEPAGSEGNPWLVGSPTAADVKAWTNGTGKLVVEGTGAMMDYTTGDPAPWYDIRNSILEGEIRSGVTHLGEQAFPECSEMTSATIPSSVTNIGQYAFNACLGLAELHIDSIESWCKVSLNPNASAPFYGSNASEKRLYVGGAAVPTTALVIPDGVETVNRYVFYGCSGLESVTIPSSVTCIGGDAFLGCSGLKSVTISSGVTSIGIRAFALCSGLESVTISSSVTSIGSSVFYKCSGLKSVTISEGVTSIDGSAFVDCSALESVTIPSSVTSIGRNAFNGCSALKSVIEMREEPPNADRDAFGRSFTGTIFVPSESVDAYKGANNWKSYAATMSGAYLVSGVAEHGAVELSKNCFPTNEYTTASETVTVTVTPDEGYQLKSLVWNDGTDHDITKTKSFTMPLACVTVTAVFEEKPEISAVSAAAELDLTPGDRVARDEETLVVNPAWGGVKTATVQIDGEPKKRTYDCASNDLWTAKALEPGRYGMELEAGTHPGAAGFWKVGADWIVLEGSNFAADVTLEGGRTYLVFGTNTIGGTLTAAADSLFLYDEGAPAGFKGEIAELPKMYRLDEVDGLKRIIAKAPGCEDNPWKVGKDGTEVVAWTNGSELVVSGKGTVDALASIKGWGGIASGIGAVKVTDASVTNVAAGAFTGIAGAKLTLPDGWRGEFPEEGVWYGATDIEMASWPLTVQGVKFLQRYPWNGKVDIDVDVTGTGLVKLSVSATIDGKPVDVKTVEGGEVDCGESGSRVKGVRLTWNALADLEPGFKSEHVRIKVTAAKGE